MLVYKSAYFRASSYRGGCSRRSQRPHIGRAPVAEKGKAPCSLLPCTPLPQWSQSELRLEGLLDHMKAKLCPTSEQEAEACQLPHPAAGSQLLDHLHPLSRPSQDREQSNKGENSRQHQASSFPSAQLQTLLSAKPHKLQGTLVSVSRHLGSRQSQLGFLFPFVSENWEKGLCRPRPHFPLSLALTLGHRSTHVLLSLGASRVRLSKGTRDAGRGAVQQQRLTAPWAGHSPQGA